MFPIALLYIIVLQYNQGGVFMKRIMVSLPDDIHDKLLQQADAEKRSLSNLIRIAVEKYLENEAARK